MSTLFGGSEQKSKSTPKDLTPSQYKDLRQPTVDQLLSLYNSGGGQTYTGQYSAPVSGNEQQILDQIQTQLNGQTQSNSTSNAFLNNLITGGQGGPASNASLGQLTAPGSIEGGTAIGDTNPYLSAAIQAAQRPIIDNFQDVVAPSLRAQFTQAGQQVQGSGSSPFQMASAKASNGLANALGDVGAQISSADFQQRQALASQEFQQLRDLTTNQELAGRGQQIDLAGLQSQEQVAQRQQQLDAVAQSQDIDRGQLENLLAGLQAQALPRLVEQYGIDQGLAEFRRRETQLLDAIKTGGALGSPTIAAESKSTGSGESSNLGSTVGSLASTAISAYGAYAGYAALAASSRRFKDDIEDADEMMLADSIRDIKLATYHYKPGMGIHGRFYSPIAEDVPEPFAGPGRSTINVYNLVGGLVASSHEKDRQIAALEARLNALESRDD